MPALCLYGVEVAHCKRGYKKIYHRDEFGRASGKWHFSRGLIARYVP